MTEENKKEQTKPLVVTASLHQKIKEAATKEGKFLQDYAAELLEEGLRQRSERTEEE